MQRSARATPPASGDLERAGNIQSGECHGGGGEGGLKGRQPPPGGICRTPGAHPKARGNGKGMSRRIVGALPLLRPARRPGQGHRNQASCAFFLTEGPAESQRPRWQKRGATQGSARRLVFCPRGLEEARAISPQVSRGLCQQRQRFSVPQFPPASNDGDRLPGLSRL